DWLIHSTLKQQDGMDFGIIGLDKEMKVVLYNQTETQCSGLSKEMVLNKHFFIEVAPCLNNYLVALKFEQQENLDEILDYILSFRMDPTYVKLRLLKKANQSISYILVERK
ncbi:MAG: PAS domain-containing protein, partial [Spirochaetes bacterium]|nr:PAS domain-containing protein [Spirochaetota bacterium]